MTLGATKKKKVQIEQNNYPNQAIIGIVSDLSEYQICARINQIFNIKLSVGQTIEIMRRNGKYEFSLYYFDDEINYCFYKLIVNHIENVCFINKLKNIDYFFIVQSESEINIKKTAHSIKNIPKIQAAIPVDSSSLSAGNRKVIFK